MPVPYTLHQTMNSHPHMDLALFDLDGPLPQRETFMEFIDHAVPLGAGCSATWPCCR